MKKILLLSLFLISHLSFADNNEIENLDFESLLATDVQITSVMKRTNKASTTPASVYVISNTQMLNAGVTSVAQALTLAPGIQVRKIDNNKWAIGIRNSAGRYTSKLLVMIDGQSIYNPSFAGVYWEALNVPIYDIERIEVIKGQGGLLWGSNATNGVVNIITKLSNDTRSTKISLKTGTTLDYEMSLRVGGDLNVAENSSYRFYINSQANDKSDLSRQWTPKDEGEKDSFGTRFDIAFDDNTSLLIQGDYTEIKMGQTLELADPVTFAGSEVTQSQKRKHTLLMLRLENRLSNRANQTLQASYAKQTGEQPYYMEKFQSYDIDYQINMLMDFAQVDIGANYRYDKTPFVGSQYLSSENETDNIKKYGVFAQVNFTLIKNELDLIIGDKSEHNSLTGWEHQPSIRFAWRVDDSQFLWASFSQGVRTPSLIEYDYKIQVNGFKVGAIFETGNELVDKTRIKTYLRGGNQLQSEKIASTEFGYRLQQNTWNLDLSLFYSEAKNTLTITPTADPLLAPSIMAFLQVADFNGFFEYVQNQMVSYKLNSDGKQSTYGVDIILNWQVNPSANITFGFNYARQEEDNVSNDLLGFNGYIKQAFFSLNKKINKTNSLMLQSRWEDGSIYKTEDFIAVDMSWNWQYNHYITVSLTGNNLLEQHHLEYARSNDTFDVGTYIDRSFTLGMIVDF
ncbi:MAG: ligand-gated channel protein [Colwellia sp.]|jgi:iron complex outermembrane receptor protein|nr:MAG: ligand-gated channel protein [Colwellia sp.]